MDVYYPGIAAGDSASIGPDGTVSAVVTPNATYQVFELSDAAFSTPLTIKTPAGLTDTKVPVGALPIFPDVYVVSPNFAHNWKSGGLVFRRDSADAKDQAVAAAVAAAQSAASTAGAAAVTDLKARIAAGDFKGTPGQDGSNVVPTAQAIAAEIQTPGTPANTALSATISEAVGNGGAGLVAPGSLAALPLMSKPPTLTITKTSTPSPEITSPVIYPYNDQAFLFTGNGPGAVGIYGKNAVGGATAAYFEWWSDAPVFDIRLNGSNLQGSLFVDGQLATRTNLTTDTSGADYILKVDFSGESKPRRFRFLGVNMLFGGVRVPGAYTCWKPNPITPFAWGLGDSYMFGQGASPLAESAFNVMCHNLGIDGLADGIGGSGWIASTNGSLPSPQSRITSKLATLTRTPDYVVFDLGYNNAMSSLDAIATGFNESVALVRQYVPTAKILVFGPATPAGPTTQLNAVRDKLKERSLALGVTFLDVTNFLTVGNKARYVGPDAIHPNTSGHVFIGQRKALLATPVLNVSQTAPTTPVEPTPATNYGINDYDHRYPLSALSLADGAELTTWPDSGSSPDPLQNLGSGAGSFGTAKYNALEGGFLQLLSTAGAGKLLATTGIVNVPRTTVLVGRASKGRQMLRVGGTLLQRVGTTGEYFLTASGTGSGGQQVVTAATTDGWVCVIVRTEASAASIFVNGVKSVAGAWTAGSPTTLRLQTNDPNPADFKFAGSVPRIITDAEAASIYSALKALYPVLP